MIYTKQEIARRIAPVARMHGIQRVYLFGSYARGEAREDSDIDLIVDKTGMGAPGLFRLSGIFADLQEALGKEIDMITLQSMDQTADFPSTLRFRERVKKEMIPIYDVTG